MPWTRRQVKYLESSGSPLTQAQKDKMNRELHDNPALGHEKKGSPAMAKSKEGKKAPYRMTHITHHDDGSHTVEHEHHRKPASKSGAFMERPDNESYSVGDGKELMSKLHEHLGIGAAKAAGSQEKELEAAEHEPPHETDEEEEETSEGE
jgi:hypothetical protein